MGGVFLRQSGIGKTIWFHAAQVRVSWYLFDFISQSVPIFITLDEKRSKTLFARAGVSRQKQKII